VSLYRQAGRASARSAVVAAVAALLLGFGVGYLVRGGGEESPSLRAAVSELRERLGPVRAGLDLVTVEYPQAVRGGRVIAGTEYAAAQADVARARKGFAAVRGDLAVLDPRRTREAAAALDRLAALVDRRAPASQVVAAARTAEAALPLA
jgi:hypothetical protein